MHSHSVLPVAHVDVRDVAYVPVDYSLLDRPSRIKTLSNYYGERARKGINAMHDHFATASHPFVAPHTQPAIRDYIHSVMLNPSAAHVHLHNGPLAMDAPLGSPFEQSVDIQISAAAPYAPHLPHHTPPPMDVHCARDAPEAPHADFPSTRHSSIVPPLPLSASPPGVCERGLLRDSGTFASISPTVLAQELHEQERAHGLSRPSSLHASRKGTIMPTSEMGAPGTLQVAYEEDLPAPRPGAFERFHRMMGPGDGEFGVGLGDPMSTLAVSEAPAHVDLACGSRHGSRMGSRVGSESGNSRRGSRAGSLYNRSQAMA